MQEELKDNWDELIEIPDRHKGRVIGKWKTKLRELETETGVRLFVKEREVYIVRGTEQQRRRAKISIGKIVV